MTARLPDSDWRQHAGLQRIIRALGEGSSQQGVLAVGGAVRDTLLGLAVHDVDLATALRPEEVTRRLEMAGIKAIPTGIEHGTVTAVADQQNFEITTFRRDVATDGRRAVIAFSDDWREDAQRRDFTMNALYADVQSGKIMDCTNGLADLEARSIRFIGDAAERIAEDHLRILRYFRFFARFGNGTPNSDAIAACRDAANSLKALSRERIADELTRMIVLPDPLLSVRLMVEHGIFAAFLPELAEDAAERLAALMAREAQHGSAPSLEARLLTLLPRDGAVIEKVARRLKLSNRLRKALIACAQEPHPTAGNILSLAYHHGRDTARDAAMLYAADSDLTACLAALDGWEKPEFPLSGGDLIAMGLEAGPAVSRMLEEIRAQWIAEGFPDEDTMKKMARTAIDGHDTK